MDIIVPDKENKVGLKKVKKKSKLQSTSNALSRVPPNAAAKEPLPRHNITIPDGHQDTGNRLWTAIESDPQSPTHWWHWIHFLHARCNCEANQLLKICRTAQTNIDLNKYLTDNSYAKILLVQCKFLYSLQKFHSALDIYKAMYSNNIGRSLYYFWINYATILQKTNKPKKAVKILHAALSSVQFSEEDKKKVQATLDGIVRDIATAPKTSKSPAPSPVVSNGTQNSSIGNHSSLKVRPLVQNPLQTPRVSGISDFATPQSSKYNPLNETPVYHSRNSTRKPRTLNPFPSKFETGPERIRKSSGSDTSDADIVPVGTQPNEQTSSNSPSNGLPVEEKNPPPIAEEPTSDESKETNYYGNEESSKPNGMVKQTTEAKPEHVSPKVEERKEKRTQTPTSTPNRESKAESSGLRLQELVVHGRKYHCLGIMGKGGSSRVIKAIGGKKMDLFAIKQVDLTEQDEQTCEGFRNEISLLCSLKGESHVVHLYDYEITNKRLSLVLELGEIDLRHLLHRLKKQPSSANQINYIKLYWQQMLEAVQVIHEKRIVHGDLKPANFVSFKGVLKLIDFGIAGAIQSNTTNIKRDSMIGTLNYIAPEALDLNPNPQIRMGVASDVWSMGIILYEMAYHTTPFASITNMFHKVQSIVSDQNVIEFADIGQPLLVEILQGCLQRNPKERLTISELLAHPFLA